jgi:hypothetical protein
LLNAPCIARISGHIAVQDASAVVGDDEESIENAEGERPHGEEIHCGDRKQISILAKQQERTLPIRERKLHLRQCVYER